MLSEDKIFKIIEEEVGDYRERVYSPLTTLSCFVFQVLSEDHSCRETVMRVIAERVTNGEKPCSSQTGGYCKARERLPEQLVNRTMKEVGMKVHENVKENWKWKGKNVILGDGTTVSMPDTKENQAVYPQPDSQKEGLGFPIARLVGLISLASGTVLNFAVGPYHGKETGEHALLREQLETFSPGDVFLADRYYCSYFLIAMLGLKGVDIVFQQHGSRNTDFRRGKRLGKKEHIVLWDKPKCPEWMDINIYQEIPDELMLREIEVDGKVIVTSFLDPKEISKKDIAQLYKQRWMIEIDFKFIKQILQMDILRCKTPEMVRKEIGVHLLAFNLLRTVMAQTAVVYGIFPRSISFKATLQALNSFADKILLVTEKISELYEALRKAIVSHRIGNRPGRAEPRAVKRRPKAYPRLAIPRNIARKELPH